MLLCIYVNFSTAFLDKSTLMLKGLLENFRKTEYLDHSPQDGVNRNPWTSCSAGSRYPNVILLEDSHINSGVLHNGFRHRQILSLETNYLWPLYRNEQHGDGAAKLLRLL